MAWTRVENSEIGAEPGSVEEWVTIGTGNAPTASTTKANTGSRSVRFGTGANHKSAGWTFTPAVMARASMWMNHNGPAIIANTRYGIIFRWVSSAGNTNYVRWKNVDNLIELVVNDSVVASASAASLGITATDTWDSYGLVIYADATNGWVTFYVNTQPALTWAGNTGTSVSEIYENGALTVVTGGWLDFVYCDDFYIETSTVEEIDESPIPHRLLWFIASGNGASSDFVGSDADSTDNYALVDDVPPDADTTYVLAEAVDLEDSYTMSDITVPSGYQVTAVIAKPMCKRAGTTETIKLRLRDAGANMVESGELAPPSSYGFVSHRFPLAPDGSAWDQTKVNAVRQGQITAGTF